MLFGIAWIVLFAAHSVTCSNISADKECTEWVVLIRHIRHFPEFELHGACDIATCNALTHVLKHSHPRISPVSGKKRSVKLDTANLDTVLRRNNVVVSKFYYNKSLGLLVHGPNLALVVSEPAQSHQVYVTQLYSEGFHMLTKLLLLQPQVSPLTPQA